MYEHAFHHGLPSLCGHCPAISFAGKIRLLIAPVGIMGARVAWSHDTIRARWALFKSHRRLSRGTDWADRRNWLTRGGRFGT